MDDTLTRLLQGAAAGFAATVALQGLRTASERWIPASMGPVRGDPGVFMVQQAQDALPPSKADSSPDAAETAAAKGLAVGYGVLPGVLYAALRPEGGNPLVGGAALGVGVWAAGYLGWLPAAGLMPPITEQSAEEAVGPLVRHALYGVAVAAFYSRLREL